MNALNEMDTLNNREVALILTVINLLGKSSDPHHVQLEFQRASREVEQAQKDPEYPLPRQR